MKINFEVILAFMCMKTRLWFCRMLEYSKKWNILAEINLLSIYSLNPFSLYLNQNETRIMYQWIKCYHFVLSYIWISDILGHILSIINDVSQAIELSNYCEIPHVCQTRLKPVAQQRPMNAMTLLILHPVNAMEKIHVVWIGHV